MVARLGFAIATDIEPDVLLLDEVLSVGDVEFQRKCIERMNTFRARGVTFVLVSHDLNAVRELCSRAVWLDAGRVVMEGPAGTVVDAFIERSSTVAPVVTPAAAVGG